MQFTILFQNLSALQEKFEKLNKKCEKYGNELLSFKMVGEPYEEENELLVNIEVSGCTPLIGDYRLVGVISKLDDGTNSIQNVPGQELPKKFRDSDFKDCDHCHTRRFRKEIVIVQNVNTEEYLQLGKTCLKDYLGISLERLVNVFSWVYELCNEAKDESFCGSSQEYVVEPLRYVSYVNLCCRKLGWVSATKAREEELTPTKAVAFSVMFPRCSYDHEMIKRYDLYLEDEDKEIAQKAIDWVQTLDNSSSDYIYNVQNIVRQEIVRYKHIGYIAAIISMYRKHLQQEEEKKLRKPSEWYGEVKKRYELKLKCVFLKEFETQYGVTTLFKFVDEDDRLFTWFASNDPGIDQGETYNLKGTIKDHDEYRGQKQTILTRCSLIKE